MHPNLPTVLPLILWAAIAHGAPVTTGIGEVEDIYLQARELKDAIKTIQAHEGTIGPAPATLPALLQRYEKTRAALVEKVSAVDAGALGAEDQRAFAVMRAALEGELGNAEAEEEAAGNGPPRCDFDPAVVAKNGFDVLAARIYACYGHAAANVAFGDEVLDRLGVLARLSITDDRDRRRRLFLALEPVWQSVNGEGSAASPWRVALQLSAARFAAGNTSIEAKASLLGVEPAQVEPWLVSVLEAWRDMTAGADLEPWDFWFEAGAMERALAAALPREALQPLNDRVYRDLDADPAQLGILYDILPRPAKGPVAYTDFAARPRLDRGIGVARVSASYSTGGAGNLAELLHETGHAIHITAIRTRPAFADWPDSDVFTEALAELAALDLYDPAWQQHYLGTSAPAPDALRAKYAGIVMDIAWALFEMRMHRDAAQDPNAVWTDLTTRYLHVRPHPEWSWWAMRGQLIDAPGYMLNYALGAILVADLRARTRDVLGPRAWGNKDWYRHVSAQLYRFGLERPSRRVIEDYLGRPVSPAALVEELQQAAAERP